MGNCRDCKHWSQPQSYLGYVSERGFCGQINSMADSEKVRAITDRIDCEWWGLTTAPEFGCVLFEPNEQYQKLMDEQPALYRQTRLDILRVRAKMGYADAIEALCVEYGESVELPKDEL